MLAKIAIFLVYTAYKHIFIDIFLVPNITFLAYSFKNIDSKDILKYYII